MKAHLLSFSYSGLSIHREIIRCFSPLSVYLPCGAHLSDYKDDVDIIVSYPPEGLRPDVDINILIEEYVNRAQELGEKSRKEIIKRGSSGNVADESIRNIRAALLGRSSIVPNEKDMIIRWHMPLQLADRFEKQRKEADSMIVTLRKMHSPLLNNAELAGKALYPLKTLEGMDADSFISESNMRHLLMAWHSLFGGYTEEGDLLLTIDRPLYNFLHAEYKNLCSNNGQHTPMAYSLKIPLIKHDDANAIFTIFSDLKFNDNTSGFADFLADFESSHYTNHEDPHILVHILHMNINRAKNETFLRIFSGRIIVLAELINPPD